MGSGYTTRVAVSVVVSRKQTKILAGKPRFSHRVTTLLERYFMPFTCLNKNFRVWPSLVLAAAVLAFGPGSVHANPSEFKLRNGLRVIVKEDHRAPTVVSMVWYKAGSMDEVNGTTGVAHVLEHMMFKGTKTVKAGEFSKTIAAAGGRDNAFTNKDYTAYFQQLHKSKLPLSFRLEADRMAIWYSPKKSLQRRSGSSWKSGACVPTISRRRWCTSS